MSERVPTVLFSATGTECDFPACRVWAAGYGMWNSLSPLQSCKSHFLNWELKVKFNGFFGRDTFLHIFTTCVVLTSSAAKLSVYFNIAKYKIQPFRVFYNSGQHDSFRNTANVHCLRVGRRSTKKYWKYLNKLHSSICFATFGTTFGHKKITCWGLAPERTGQFARKCNPKL